jgi:carbohydrate-binding DOMON domain-containing protein
MVSASQTCTVGSRPTYSGPCIIRIIQTFTWHHVKHPCKDVTKLRTHQNKTPCRDVSTYLTRSHEVFDGVDTQTQDVICVLCVEFLRVFLTVIHDSRSCHMVHHFTSLSVE